MNCLSKIVLFGFISSPAFSSPSSEVSEVAIVGNGCSLEEVVAGDGLPTKIKIGGLRAEASIEDLVVHKKCLLKIKLNVPNGFRIGVTGRSLQAATKLVGAGQIAVSLLERFVGQEDEKSVAQNIEVEGEQSIALKNEETHWAKCGDQQPTLKISGNITAMVASEGQPLATAAADILELPVFIYQKCPQR
jgi:hypothetical protein